MDENGLTAKRVTLHAEVDRKSPHAQPGIRIRPSYRAGYRTCFTDLQCSEGESQVTEYSGVIALLSGERKSRALQMICAILLVARKVLEITDAFRCITDVLRSVIW